MSRTYRRKKGESPGKHITHDCVMVDSYPTYNCRWRREIWQDIPRAGKDLKKHLAKYHADGYKHMNHVPSWFVRIFCNKAY